METSTGDFRTLLVVLRRRKWTVLLVTALTLGAALFFSFRQEPTYTSSARVLVKPLNPNQALGGFNYNFLVSMGTEAALARSPAVGTRASRIVETNGGSPQQTGEVTIENPADTTFLDITYSDHDAAVARAWAQGYAVGYIENREQQAARAYASAASGYDNTITELQQQIDAKRRELDAARTVDERSLIRQQLETIQQQLTVIQAQRAQLPIPSDDTAEIIDPADIPSSPSSPNHVQNGILGFVAGLALGIGLAFARERLDDRLHGREDLEGQIGAPTLGVIPEVTGWRRRKTAKLISRDEPESSAAEAYRTVRANLLYLAREGELKTLAVVSPSLGEGKTTSTANLAITLAATGKRVIAVSCDLRRPRLHDFFGLLNLAGVTDVVRGDATLAEVAQRCGIETLRVVPSGAVPPNPAELLGSDAMAEFLADLRRAADFVLLDTAPVLAVSDALIVTRQTDATLIVVDAGKTTRTAVAHARSQLEQAGAVILGGVLNNLDASTAKTYPSYMRSYYGYGYRARHGDGATPERNGKVKQRTAAPEHIWE